MTSVSPGRIGPVGSVGSGGRNGAEGTRQALGTIAAAVAGRIAGELQLMTDPDGRHGRPVPGHELYGIDELAAGLALQLNATPFEQGEITRLLHLFASEVAARVGAVPDARSLDDIAGMIGRQGSEVRDARAAIALIQRLVTELSA